MTDIKFTDADIIDLESEIERAIEYSVSGSPFDTERALNMIIESVKYSRYTGANYGADRVDSEGNYTDIEGVSRSIYDEV